MRIVWLFLIACTGNDDLGVSAGDDLADPQLPARGSEDVLTWLRAGLYTSWHCELEPHPPRMPSPHAQNRICNNDALQLAADGAGPYPVGSASVKEIYGDTGVRLFAVYRKVEAGGGGDTWYWYEGIEGRTDTNAVGSDRCTGCHSRAPRDFVYTIVP